MTDQQEFDDRAVQVLRRVGKGKLLGSMASLFESNAPARFSAMREAVRTGHPEGAAMPAHSLKSSAGQLGAIGLQRICGDIEKAAEEGDVARIKALLTAAEPMLARALAWVGSKSLEEESEEWQRSP